MPNLEALPDEGEWVTPEAIWGAVADIRILRPIGALEIEVALDGAEPTERWQIDGQSGQSFIGSAPDLFIGDGVTRASGRLLPALPTASRLIWRHRPTPRTVRSAHGEHGHRGGDAPLHSKYRK